MDILLAKISRTLKKVLFGSNIDVFQSYRSDGLQNALPYSPTSSLDADQWYYLDDLPSKRINNPIENASTPSSNDWIQVDHSEYASIRFLALIDKQNRRVFYQKIPKSMLIKKPFIQCFGLNDEPTIANDPIILLNEIPDAIYEECSGKLYFKHISKLTNIFRGIDQQFKEATEEEVSSFINSNIFSTLTGFDIKKVPSPIRKKVGNVQNHYDSFNDEEKTEFIINVQKYLPHINFHDGKFNITNNEDIRDLADALDQCFHETPITKEARRTQSYRKLA